MKIIKISVLKRIILALVYIALYHFSYINYINPQFEYSYYYYFNRPLGLYVYLYVITLLPLIFYRNALTVSNFGATLIYVLCYLPSQLTLTFMWQQNLGELLLAITMLSLGMCAIFILTPLHMLNSVSKNKYNTYCQNIFNTAFYKTKLQKTNIINSSGIFLSKYSSMIIIILTGITIIALVVTNYSHMRIVDFDHVYTLRFEFRDLNNNTLLNYLILWLSVCFIPFYMAAGLIQHKKIYILIAVASSILIYAANGSKIVVLLPLVMYGLKFLLQLKGDFLNWMLGIIICLVGVAVVGINVSELDMYKSILLVRTLSTGGWTMAIYYDFFINHSHTYYTHIGFINRLFGGYPYENFELGQVIGIEYFGSPDANYNANFWASDGFAALGLFGIIPATAALIVMMLIFNRIASSFNFMFVALWSTGFWIVLLNAPLSLSLLSGGGLFIMLLLGCSLYTAKTRNYKNNLRRCNDIN